MDGSICKIKHGQLICRWRLSFVTWFGGSFFIAVGIFGFWMGAASWHYRNGKPVSPWLHHLLFTVFLLFGSTLVFLRRRVVIDPINDFVETSYRFILRFGYRRYPLSSFQKVVLRKDPEDTRFCYEVLLVGSHRIVELGAHQRPDPAVRMAEAVAKQSGLVMESLL
jgi:hypothetical protein